MVSDSHVRALVRLMALQIAGNQNTDAAEQILAWAYEGEETLFIDQVVSPDSNPDVDYLYSLYPGKDAANGNRSTNKGSKNKTQIKNLLKKYSVTELEAIILWEVNTKTESKGFLRNFETFLNNLPELEDIQVQQRENKPVAKPKDPYHL